MPLSSKRQAMLDIYCHVFKNLIDYLDHFDEASDEYNCYSIVEDCFDLAIKEFGNNPVQSEEKGFMLKDLLDKIYGIFLLKYSSHKDVLAIFEKYKSRVLSTSIVSTNLEDHKSTGQGLSCNCYESFCSKHYFGTKRKAKLVIEPSNQFKISSFPNKTGGMSKICFYFASSNFTFQHYLNLPFYFFHEYLSHIHSGKFSAEDNPERTCSFQDGWLIYTGYLWYKDFLNFQSQSENIRYRKYYLNKYTYQIVYAQNNKYIQKGYELARDFNDIIGNRLFYKISLLLASSDHDALPNQPYVHTKFLISVNRWMQRFSELELKEKEEAVEWLEIAIDDTEPLKTLFEALEELL